MDLECWKPDMFQPEPAAIFAEKKMEEIRAMAMKHLIKLHQEVERVNTLILAMLQAFNQQGKIYIGINREKVSEKVILKAIGCMLDHNTAFDFFDRKFAMVPVKEQIDNIIIRIADFMWYLFRQRWIGVQIPELPEILQKPVMLKEVL